MVRSFALIGSLLCGAGLAGACLGSENGGGGSGPIDAPGGAAHDAHYFHDAAVHAGDAGAGGGDAGAFTCRNQVTTGNNQGHHNPGLDCMDSCHDHEFTVAGTLYTTSAGGTIVSGATVTALDSLGNSVDMVSQTNGNFYSSLFVQFPVTLYVSECPTISMMTELDQGTGDKGCNMSGCHDGTGSAGRIHLP